MNPIAYFPHAYFDLCALTLALGFLAMIADEFPRVALTPLRFPMREPAPRGLSGQGAWATVSAAPSRFSQQRTPGPQLGLAA